MTAHTQDDSELNWAALAQGGTTLVVYMGVARLEQVRQGLLAGGMAPEMPVAMIENASLPQQRECRSDVQGMVEAARAFGLRSPAILVIGEVVGEQQAVGRIAIAG
ncbi:Uroporphyrinogen-III C-methyltransferase [compost metagenome]